jgi:hypothetical protein
VWKGVCTGGIFLAPGSRWLLCVEERMQLSEGAWVETALR